MRQQYSTLLFENIFCCILCIIFCIVLKGFFLLQVWCQQCWKLLVWILRSANGTLEVEGKIFFKFVLSMKPTNRIWISFMLLLWCRFCSLTANGHYMQKRILNIKRLYNDIKVSKSWLKVNFWLNYLFNNVNNKF